MKILAIADVEEKSLWDFYDREKTKGVDLIISCGDLNRHYLDFLVTMTNCPLLYVHGNHDDDYLKDPPLGCICIEDRVFDYQGLRILGLGGSMRYKPGPCMYTEQEMKSRIGHMMPEIMLKNGFDVLVTHAPARGYGDMEDLPHTGFECFNTLMNRWHPKYMLHGHVHQTYGGGDFKRELMHPCGTKIINCFDKYYINIGDEDHPKAGKTGSFLYDLFIRSQMKVGTFK